MYNVISDPPGPSMCIEARLCCRLFDYVPGVSINKIRIAISYSHLYFGTRPPNFKILLETSSFKYSNLSALFCLILSYKTPSVNECMSSNW